MKLFPILFALLIGGCTNYEYDVVQPASFAIHVGTKSETRFVRDGLNYQLITADNRLVMKIENASDDAVQLAGDQSTVVDPNGQSHPLRSQTIAPRSFAKLIFPPLRPTVERTGPTFGFGIGTQIGSRHRLRDDLDDFDSYDEPRYLTIVDDNALYWDWPGEGDIRLTLVLSGKGQSLHHDFVIRRVKMK